MGMPLSMKDNVVAGKAPPGEHRDPGHEDSSALLAHPRSHSATRIEK
jgi:hypothetical protein